MSEQPTTPTTQTPEATPATPAPVTAPNSADTPAPATPEAPSTPVDTSASSTPEHVEPKPADPAPVEHDDDEATEDDHEAGDVVTFEVENPYHDGGPRVETHAGLVVAAKDGRVRVLDLGDVDALADFPAGAVQRA